MSTIEIEEIDNSNTEIYITINRKLYVLDLYTHYDEVETARVLMRLAVELIEGI